MQEKLPKIQKNIMGFSPEEVERIVSIVGPTREDLNRFKKSEEAIDSFFVFLDALRNAASFFGYSYYLTPNPKAYRRASELTYEELHKRLVRSLTYHLPKK